MTTNIWESTDRQLTWPEAVTKRWCSKGGGTYEQDLQSYLQSGKELLCGYIRICQSTYEKCRESHAGLGYCRYDGWGVIVRGGNEFCRSQYDGGQHIGRWNSHRTFW